MKIRKLKTPKSKSHPVVNGLLLDSIEYSHSNKIIGVGIVLIEKKGAQTIWAMTPNASYPEMLGQLDRLKDKILHSWKTE